MSSTAPKIGFDRFIQLDWVIAAFKLRAGISTLSELDELLDAAGLGEEAKAKTRTKLNALSIQPRPDLIDFVDRGIDLFKEKQNMPNAALAWGIAIAAYPFFGKVAEITGRLTSIQGGCSSMEIHRRISEVFGEREVIKRATQAVLQTQANWGAIQRVEHGKRLIRQTQTPLTDDLSIAWFVEGALRYTGKSLPVATLQSLAVIYPYTFDQSLAYVLSHSSTLELRVEGSSKQLVSLRETL